MTPESSIPLSTVRGEGFLIAKKKTVHKGQFVIFWWARRDLNPQGLLDQRILSPPRIPIPPLARISYGGTYESRTRLKGFADLRVTAPPTRHKKVTDGIVAVFSPLAYHGPDYSITFGWS